MARGSDLQKGGENNVVFDKYSYVTVRINSWGTTVRNTVPRANQSVLNWSWLFTNYTIPQLCDAYLGGSSILIQSQSDSYADKNAIRTIKRFFIL